MNLPFQNNGSSIISLYEDFSYEKALAELFPDLPIIMDADIGHVPPKMTLINGAITEIKCENGKGVIKQQI